MRPQVPESGEWSARHELCNQPRRFINPAIEIPEGDGERLFDLLDERRAAFVNSEHEALDLFIERGSEYLEWVGWLHQSFPGHHDLLDLPQEAIARWLEITAGRASDDAQGYYLTGLRGLALTAPALLAGHTGQDYFFHLRGWFNNQNSATNNFLHTAWTQWLVQRQAPNRSTWINDQDDRVMVRQLAERRRDLARDPSRGDTRVELLFNLVQDVAVLTSLGLPPRDSLTSDELTSVRQQFHGDPRLGQSDLRLGILFYTTLITSGGLRWDDTGWQLQGAADLPHSWSPALPPRRTAARPVCVGGRV